MLDLTLEHLDVYIDGASHELDRVVKSCGESEHWRLPFSPSLDVPLSAALTNLEASVYTPAEKAAILVAAHRVVVGEHCHSHRRSVWPD
jgi:hypothetical protein